MPTENGFYKYHIFCCGNARPDDHPRGCCKARGADDLRNYLRARVKEEKIPQTRVNNAGCLDQCEQGPVIVVYPENVWYRATTREDIDAIVDEHLKSGMPVARLRFA